MTGVDAMKTVAAASLIGVILVCVEIVELCEGIVDRINEWGHQDDSPETWEPGMREWYGVHFRKISEFRRGL